jgi:hypothetical protein
MFKNKFKYQLMGTKLLNLYISEPYTAMCTLAVKSTIAFTVIGDCMHFLTAYRGKENKSEKAHFYVLEGDCDQTTGFP